MKISCFQIDSKINQNILLNGSANYQLNASSTNSVSSSLQSEIDVEPPGIHSSSRMIQVGGLCGSLSGSLDNNLKITPMFNKVSDKMIDIILHYFENLKGPSIYE